MNRRRFIGSSAALLALPLASRGELPADHQDVLHHRKKRIVVQYDANDTMWSFWKSQRGGDTSFDRFAKAVFSFPDEPGSQIDAIWWDIGGSPLGCSYPSKIEPPVDHPLLQQWLRDGVDWVAQLVKETRRRKLEVFWNHRISEVECLPEGGLSKQPHPLKVSHPDWATPAAWWPQRMWNLAAPGLREHKVAVLRELVSKYDLDGLQIDFSRHIPCLPVGHQWELRGEVTAFMRMVRQMLLEVAQKRGRPLLLAAKVPQTMEGCKADGFDLAAWSQEQLVDILTLGSRTMDVDVEGIRAAVGRRVQLQPCFDDHHTTDGYRYQSIEFMRGVFANHWQRGADSVATFNWAIGTPEQVAAVGASSGPPSHQAAYHEVGDAKTMVGKDKIFAVERRGGYPWAEGFFNRNDTAPLPQPLGNNELVLHISDAPSASAHLKLRLVLFGAGEGDTFEVKMNGQFLPEPTRDPQWKDAQIFSPGKQPASGGKGDYKVNPKQRLLALDFAVPAAAWKQGVNRIAIRSGSAGQLEKIEGHLVFK